jgi:hypothetical protein
MARKLKPFKRFPVAFDDTGLEAAVLMGMTEPHSFARKSKCTLFSNGDFQLMPQRGYGLQPRVAASATLGQGSDLVLNRNAVAAALCISL